MNTHHANPSSSRGVAAAPAAPRSGGLPDSFDGGSMNHKDKEGRGPPMSYSQPRVSRLGTFRELTRAGGAAFADLFTTDSNDGCVLNSSSSYTCTAP
jgi:hypothetical protein